MFRKQLGTRTQKDAGYQIVFVTCEFAKGKWDTRVVFDKDAKITTVVLSVGGFLGVGSKDVAVKWSDLTFGKDGKSVVLTTSLTKDELTALPDYTKTERRQTAPPETAAAPPTRTPNPPPANR